MENIKERVQRLYPEQYETVYEKIEDLIKSWQGKITKSYPWVNETDTMMITYGDGIRRKGEAPLKTLKQFLDQELKGYISAVHLLPMFPYTSDDGFSVTDFREIHEDLGDWSDIDALNQQYDLMFDGVINHVSKSSMYFQEYRKGNPSYSKFFIECDPQKDYSKVTRPRTLPLLTAFDTVMGQRYIWTTFSEDQIDLNYKCPDVLLEVLDVLLFYASRGARFVRLDAIGFAWKEEGTTCMHLWQTHEMIKLVRQVLESCVTGCTLITETNVPHKDNISYFGNGHDEAGLVYQFPLPPLTLHSFISGNTRHLTDWADSLEPTTRDTTYFNFLASHDGIGMRPVEDILSKEEQKQMADAVLARGGQIGYRTLSDGTEVPYELNINYLDAVAGDEKDRKCMAQKFMAAQCILLSMMGMPGIYYHSLLGSRNCYGDFEESGIKRRINREKLDVDVLKQELKDQESLRYQVLSRYRTMLDLRKHEPAFAPNSPQKMVRLDSRLLVLVRGDVETGILCIVNVSGDRVKADTEYKGTDLFSGDRMEGALTLEPYAYQWIKLER